MAFDLGDPSSAVVRSRGLAFSPDGTHLFAVTGTGKEVLFRVLNPLANMTSLSLSPSALTKTYGQSAALTARLAGAANPQGKKISLYATPLGRSERLVTSGRTDSTGTVRLKTGPSREGIRGDQVRR